MQMRYIKYQRKEALKNTAAIFSIATVLFILAAVNSFISYSIDYRSDKKVISKVIGSMNQQVLPSDLGFHVKFSATQAILCL